MGARAEPARPPWSAPTSGASAARLVVPEQAVGVDTAEVLLDELVGLAVFDALSEEAPLGRAHVLFLILPPNRCPRPALDETLPKPGHEKRV